MPIIQFNNKKIFYKVSGHGKTIVLLHGFTESQQIWKHFVKSLSNEFLVVTIDLPGHGKSECIAEVHTMELQAEVVHAVLKNAQVPVLFVIGMKDAKIPVDRSWEMISLPRRSEIHLFKDVSHMSFIEAPVETLQAIYCFACQTL